MGNHQQHAPKERSPCYTQTPNTAQNVFEFDELTFDSCFDSGNLMLADKFAPGKYDLWIAPDCYKTAYEVNNCVWFYFKVSHVELLGAPERSIGFKIKNMKRVEYNNYARQGMVPVYSSPVNKGEWHYLPTPIQECKIVGPNLEIKFSYTFNELEKKEGVYFAFTFPYTLSDCQKYINSLEEKYSHHQNIYFHRELLTRSNEGRPIELITITGHDNTSLNPQADTEREPLLPHLFPNHAQQQHEHGGAGSQNPQPQRPIIFKNKQYVFFSARVHPGEPPANYMLQGLLDSLLDPEDPASKVLLQNFVFVIIPMINPDGVYKGYARTDARGTNLQSVYHLADGKHREYPGPYGVLQVSKSLAKDGRLVLYIDLHAHSNKDGAFLYGTYHPEFNSRADMRLFARILDICSRNFDYQSCEFGSLKILQDPTKAGVAKTEVRKQTNIVHAYTLETSFHVTTKDPQRYSIEANPKKDLTRSIMKRIGVKDFLEVGEAIKNAILEMFHTEHPKSQVCCTWFGNKEGLRKEICEQMIQARKAHQEAMKKNQQEVVKKEDLENVPPNVEKVKEEGEIKVGQVKGEENKGIKIVTE